jgi:hypothetical protein
LIGERKDIVDFRVLIFDFQAFGVTAVAAEQINLKSKI